MKVNIGCVAVQNFNAFKNKVRNGEREKKRCAYNPKKSH